MKESPITHIRLDENEIITHVKVGEYEYQKMTIIELILDNKEKFYILDEKTRDIRNLYAVRTIEGKFVLSTDKCGITENLRFLPRVDENKKIHDECF